MDWVQGFWDCIHFLMAFWSTRKKSRGFWNGIHIYTFFIAVLMEHRSWKPHSRLELSLQIGGNAMNGILIMGQLSHRRTGNRIFYQSLSWIVGRISMDGIPKIGVYTYN